VATRIDSLRQLDGWQELARHADEVRDLHLRDLFAENRDRGERSSSRPRTTISTTPRIA
jgi:hypothetical protein